MIEDENINTINEGENDKVLNTLDYITEDGFFITNQLNSSKDKLILKINFSEAKKYYYQREYTYKELIKVCPLFTLEDNIEGIYHIITESIKNYGAKVCYDKTNENIMNLTIKIKINSKTKEFKLQLDKTDIPKEEFLSSLVDKINNLIEERKQAYGVKYFKDMKNELESKKKEFT